MSPLFKINFVAEEKNFNVQPGSNTSVYSKRLRAGKRRTYFFDVRSTRGNDYFICITESKKRLDDDSYERHKLHLYKEDFNKFLDTLAETVNHVKTELMPDYDFTSFDHDENYNVDEGTNNLVVEPTSNTDNADVKTKTEFVENKVAPEFVEKPLLRDFSDVEEWKL